MFYDRTTFFNYIRTTLPANKQLTQSQVDGINILLAEGEARKISVGWIAYILATTWFETAFTMQPISEYGGLAYLQSKKYYPYYGRGYDQLTWSYNYKIMGDWIGVDLFNHPELALQPDVAVKVIYEGMLRGMFTAKKLSDYIDNVTEADEQEYQEFVKARAIINGTDKAATIAGYAMIFERALISSQTVSVISPSLALDSDPTTNQIIVGPPPSDSDNNYGRFRADPTTVWGLFATAFVSILGILGQLSPLLQGSIIVFVLVIVGIVTFRTLFPSQKQVVGMLR